MADATTTHYADDVPTLHNPISQYNIDEPKHDPKSSSSNVMVARLVP
jgi:hypothetical protein